MADLLERGAAWLEAMRARHTTRSVTYTRGAAAVTVPASAGKTVFEIADAGGFSQQVESRDFLVARAALVLDGAATLPRRGDQVRETQGGATSVYEVAAPGGEPHYRFSDPYRLCLRIHTKLIGTE